MPQDPRIKHIVTLMMENRSFDHLLGLMKAENPALRGISPGEYSNDTTTGVAIPVSAGATSQGQLPIDPGHEFVDVYMQMYGKPFAGVTTGTPDMSGFVQNYEQLAGQGKGDVVMRCFAPDDLPTLTSLARSYAVCDAWFSSVPGPTLPNRAFAHFGTSFGRLDMSPDYFRMRPSIYQRLRQSGKRGKIYYYDETSSTLGLTFLLSDQASYFGLLGDFKKACKKNQLPEYAFVEPNYVNHDGRLACDQHPDNDVVAGDSFLREIYDAIRSNDDVWASTLLLIVWDEHGGLFDHEVPPAVGHPDDFTSTTPKFAFDRLGVRVPAIVVSPYVEAGVVDHTVYEHSSIPATVTEQFIGPPATNSPFSREKWASTFLHLLTRTAARTDDPFAAQVLAAAGRRRTPIAALRAKPPRHRLPSSTPLSGLLRQQVHDAHFVLVRHHPDRAKSFKPDAVRTEAEAARFLKRAHAIVNPHAAARKSARAVPRAATPPRRRRKPAAAKRGRRR
jgi:phospholipase C